MLPLSLYLVSFILCFEGKAWYRRAWYVPMLVLVLGGMSYGFIADITVWVAIALYCGGLFTACMVCHGELARLKPHSRYLTIFYVMVAIGGALGGGFVAVVAPQLFSGDYDLAVGMTATAVLVVAVLYYDPACRLHRVRGKMPWLALMGLTTALASTLAYGAYQLISHSRLMARNFYGTLRISDAGEGEDLRRTLVHGTIIHGEQYLAIDRRRWPTTYFGENTGLGMAILAGRSDSPQRIGVIGLGAGTLAAYGRPKDYYRFYEINPLVIQLAHSEFTFLSDCPATVETVLGDARLSLEQELPQNFDVLVVDAFSGDSVPIHLLTREAFAMYFRHLKPSGILAVHVSNSYLELAPIVKLAADYYSKEARLVDSDEDEEKDAFTATWVLVSGRLGVFKARVFDETADEIKPKATVRLWTDDYSSIYRILY